MPILAVVDGSEPVHDFALASLSGSLLRDLTASSSSVTAALTGAPAGLCFVRQWEADSGTLVWDDVVRVSATGSTGSPVPAPVQVATLAGEGDVEVSAEIDDADSCASHCLCSLLLWRRLSPFAAPCSRAGLSTGVQHGAGHCLP